MKSENGRHEAAIRFTIEVHVYLFYRMVANLQSLAPSINYRYYSSTCRQPRALAMQDQVTDTAVA